MDDRRLSRWAEIEQIAKEKSTFWQGLHRITSAHLLYTAQIVSFLVKNYDTIIIPKFNGHQMASKLNSKTVRKMLTWSHGKFRSFLKLKAEEYSCEVIEINEAYTSKTCGSCGHINEKLGSKKDWKCEKCGTEHDRDANGARNIFMRALLDSTLEKEKKNFHHALLANVNRKESVYKNYER